MTLEEEFWADPRNRPQYDPDTLQTTFAAPPEISDEEEDPMPVGRKPLAVPDPLPDPSPMIASNDPEFRPPHRGTEAQDDEGGGYDWRRMLASLFGGGEGVSQYDRQKLAEMQARLQQRQSEAQGRRADAQERRAQEMHDAMLPKRQAEAADLASKTRWRDAETAMNDPTSDQSRAAVAAMASRIEAQATRLPDGEAKQLMLSFVQNVRKPNSPMSATEAAKWARDFRIDVSDIVRDSMDAARRKHMAAQDANMVRDDASRAAAVQTKEINIRNQAQDKLNTEVNDLESALSQMTDLEKLKEGVNTGFIMNALSKVGEKFDMTSDQRNSLNALVARIFNQETKKLAGAAVSAQEWARISPQIPQASDDDGVFMSKLRKAMEVTRDILARRKQQYQLNSRGKSTDTSVTGRNAAAEGVAADNSAQAAKVARAKAILADPNESPEKKAKAERWLKAQQ